MPSPDKHGPETTFKVVTVARNEIEAGMIAGCLESAGIKCVCRQAVSAFGAADRPKSIYVPEADLKRAREVLGIRPDPSESPTQAIPAKDGDLEVPIPARRDFLSVVEKVAGRVLHKRPGETDRPPGQSD